DLGNALPPGTRLGEFELTGLVGEGGFGIVYLAYDHSLHRTVALKEYMPSALAARTQGVTVSVRSARHEETFNAGLRSFINEARLLAQFDHPSLVKVYRFWEGNGTAYMVMPFYEGPTLKQALKKMPEPPSEEWLKTLLAQLVEALATIHREQCFHRDIAPDNILLLKDGRPLLLDFGAARRVIGDMTQALTVILKPGYAPVEQYAEVPHMKQGAWTDVYALAAVVYFAIIGKAPTPSVGRMMNDTLAPLAQVAAGKYSNAFLRGVDRALAVKPEDRPQSMAELGELLGLAIVSHTVTMLPPPEKAVEKAIVPPPGPPGKSKRPLYIVGAVAAGVVGAALLINPPWQDSKQPTISEPDKPVAQKPAPATEPTISKPLETQPIQEPQVAVVKPAEKIEPPKTQTPAVAKPFDPIDALDEIFQNRNREHAVAVQLQQPKVRIGRDRLTFSLNSSKPGYLYILMVGTDRGQFNLLFPNAVDRNNRVGAYTDITLPRKGWTMVAGGPAGTDHFVAIVSENPRDFTAAGLRKVDPFAEFPLATATRIAQEHGGEGSPFAGTPVCAKGVTNCSGAYGATTFSIEEVASTAAVKPAARPPVQAVAKPKPPRTPRQDQAADDTEEPVTKPRRQRQAEAQPAGEPRLSSIPGGGRPSPQVERYLRQQAEREERQSAPSRVPNPNQYIPGGGRFPY
ncbi:MAG: protein kinase, partial [Rhodocyclaceae bacterium]